MVSRFRISAVAGMLVVGLLAVQYSSAAKRKRPIRKLTFDPTAEKVGMFDGIDNGTIEVKMIPKNSLQGILLVENKTQQPITVELPEAFVGVQILKQAEEGGGGGVDQIGRPMMIVEFETADGHRSSDISAPWGRRTCCVASVPVL